ncbi:MAG: hypothetical protein EAZ07_08775 [Cytophagales bacterium]|nr:MAG: hypothetical protein EAZ07_08775 [Cytophagales bacterium]
MKKILLLIAFVLGISASYAQSNGKMKGLSDSEKADKAIKHLTKVMTLSPDQAVKVKEAVTKRISEISALRASNTTDKKALRASIMKVRENWDTELKSIVSPEQFEKYTLMKNQAKQKRMENKPNKKSKATQAIETPEEAENLF